MRPGATVIRHPCVPSLRAIETRPTATPSSDSHAGQLRRQSSTVSWGSSVRGRHGPISLPMARGYEHRQSHQHDRRARAFRSLAVHPLERVWVILST